ncbi:MAG: hypothetical protein AB8W37_12255 [Arsenophonus endosymbiont of Dermacentor nuttalli]
MRFEPLGGDYPNPRKEIVTMTTLVFRNTVLETISHKWKDLVYFR